MFDLRLTNGHGSGENYNTLLLISEKNITWHFWKHPRTPMCHLVTFSHPRPPPPSSVTYYLNDPKQNDFFDLITELYICNWYFLTLLLTLFVNLYKGIPFYILSNLDLGWNNQQFFFQIFLLITYMIRVREFSRKLVYFFKDPQ